MLGFTKEELLGKKAEIIHLSTEMYKEFCEKAFNQVRNNKTVKLDWPCKNKNGQTVWCRMAGVPVIGADEVLWTVVDISERVTSLKRLKNSLLNFLNTYQLKFISLYFLGSKMLKLKPTERS